MIIDREDRLEVQQLHSELKDFKAKYHRRLVTLLESRRSRQQVKVEKIKQLKAEILKDLDEGVEMNLIADKIIANRKHKDNRAGVLPGPLSDYLECDTID